MDQLMKLGPFAAIGRLWNDLSAAQRAIVIAFVALAIVVGSFTALIASKPRMAVLFSGLDSEDAGAIVQRLNDEKVPYEISGDGGTVEVPADKVYDMRLKMATQGLPQGGSVGFELFDKTSFGMSEFTERMNYQRAIQGELTRTICQFRPVISARVHISIPDDKIFASEQEPAKASVALKLRRGTPLSDEQVGGIVHLVSSAIQSLRPENVDVIDQDGNVLSAGMGGAGGVMSANQLKLKRQYENEVASNLQSMLTRIVGPDKAVVRVSADMTFDEKQSKAETYEPVKAAQPRGGQATQPGKGEQSVQLGPAGVLQSQETLTEKYGNGAAGNTPRPPQINSNGDNYDRTTTTAQYQVSHTTEQTVFAPGTLKRLSVAVLVDKSVPSSQVTSIRNAVIAAAGIDQQTRGDQVQVQAVEFDKSTQKQVDKGMAAASRNELITTVAKNGGAVILLIGFLMVLRSIVTGIKVQAPLPGTLHQPRESEFSLPVAQAPATAHAAAEQQIKESTPLSPTDLPAEVTQSNPEELARLVRSWMSEQ